MSRFGAGTDYGLAIVRAAAGGAFGPATPLTSGGYAVGVRLVLPAAGPALAAWAQRGLRFSELAAGDG